MPIYEPEYLNSAQDIIKALKISHTTLQGFVREGAPIGVLSGKGKRKRYRAEKHQLMQWVLARKE